MAISFWHLLGQAALIDCLFGRKDKSAAEQIPQHSAEYYEEQEERISSLEDKIFSAQSRIDELRLHLDKHLDRDSDEYFETQCHIDDLEDDLSQMEDEADRLREDLEDEFEDEFDF
ncbi:MAG: hypothetical protein NC217_07440 [Muribaculaceae bacterium]|nr:hypothetical protein [Muribaculaceae bacterium]